MSESDSTTRSEMGVFSSPIVDRCRAEGGVWQLAGGQILLPNVFGFCRGVKHALAMLDQAVTEHGRKGQRLFLLGQIIHNPWVNEYFERRGVRILSPAQVGELERVIAPADCAIIPAFGVPLPIEQRLRVLGCETVDTSCGDVRRLWTWAQKAANQGYGVLIFGRADHDETVVTKSRLAACGGKYLVAGKLSQVRQFCQLISGELDASQFREVFTDQATNSASLEPFERLAQVSQTTMLYDETMDVRQQVRRAFAGRFGERGLDQRLLFQPTVCRATQARQAAAVELCQAKLDLVIVVGGFGSSNTRHLYELARGYASAYFIENAQAIDAQGLLHTVDADTNEPVTVSDWLPSRRPLRIGVLAGASSPEVVVGEVMARLASFLQ